MNVAHKSRMTKWRATDAANIYRTADDTRDDDPQGGNTRGTVMTARHMARSNTPSESADPTSEDTPEGPSSGQTGQQRRASIVRFVSSLGFFSHTRTTPKGASRVRYNTYSLLSSSLGPFRLCQIEDGYAGDAESA